MKRHEADTESKQVSPFSALAQYVHRERSANASRAARHSDTETSSPFAMIVVAKDAGLSQLHGSREIVLGPLMTLILNVCAKASARTTSTECGNARNGALGMTDSLDSSQPVVRCYRLCQNS
jgi:hypothetical protein